MWKASLGGKLYKYSPLVVNTSEIYALIYGFTLTEVANTPTYTNISSSMAIQYSKVEYGKSELHILE